MFVDHRTMNDLVKEIVFLRKQLERMQTKGLPTKLWLILKRRMRQLNDLLTVCGKVRAKANKDN
jgi:hypothetical protein